MTVYLLGQKKGDKSEVRGAVREKDIAIQWKTQPNHTVFELEVDPGLGGIDFRLMEWK